CYQHSRGWAF
nr:immunoglobulin light chain junction region [Macaca mulatta]MOV78555.1 immunoglobulin light chain junction region [Macaca mulatta]MOV78642.1 immunoglobulin light chain junction region [Macaca mulatta]MOV79134.1 immunoglobulin light chain junction region [Macaca mulatta]MOV79443.1 immunoglobulin light chain junction region [Macaca mulatta]